VVLSLLNPTSGHLMTTEEDLRGREVIFVRPPVLKPALAAVLPLEHQDAGLPIDHSCTQQCPQGSTLAGL
jgi:hypothetical protein